MSLACPPGPRGQTEGIQRSSRALASPDPALPQRRCSSLLRVRLTLLVCTHVIITSVVLFIRFMMGPDKPAISGTVAISGLLHVYTYTCRSHAAVGNIHPLLTLGMRVQQGLQSHAAVGNTHDISNTHGFIALYCTVIRESVDSLCRDGADTPMPPYIGKAFTRTNFEDLSYMIMVCE